MDTEQEVKMDERTVAVAHAANSWGLNFITLALLIDVMCRAAFFNEAAWDLLALVVVSGAISSAYMARQKVLGQVFGWKSAIILIVVAMVVSFVVAAIIPMTKIM